MKKVLHVCCANCLADCIEAFREDGSEVTLLWANPNIHPLVEWRKRLKSVRLLSERLGLSLVEDPYDLRGFLKAVIGEMGTRKGPFRVPSPRCRVCYDIRLGRTAELARSLGAEAFSTTLLVSHHQEGDSLLEAGRDAAERHGVGFGGWRHEKAPSVSPPPGLFGKAAARPRDLKLYKQSYCGCVFSEEERFGNTTRGLGG